jgi:hypothetical protein
LKILISTYPWNQESLASGEKEWYSFPILIQ